MKKSYLTLLDASGIAITSAVPVEEIMKRIDGRAWDQNVRDALADAAASGGAVVDIENNFSVLVLDERLWESVSNKLPTLSDIIRDLKIPQTKG